MIGSVFDGFISARIATDGAMINLKRAGDGPPVLLLHGYPQNLVMWHKVAPRLAERYTVVATDLRGYGDSSKPDGGGDHAGYGKRATARDQVEVMARLGFARFHVVGHDRGARVGHRMALDHRERVRSLAVLDVVPTWDVFHAIDRHVATAYFHWFLMLQPAPLAETLIGSNAEYYLRWLLARWCAAPGAITEAAFAEYLRCFSDPATLHAMCEDYRAVTVDLEHDAADWNRKLACPVLVLWGEANPRQSGWPSLSMDIMASWRARADRVTGAALPCGHFLPEEAPEETTAALLEFLAGQ